jgi:hypothetical protein
VVRPFEHHRDRRQGGHEDHQPLEVGDESEEFVNRFETNFPLFSSHRIFQSSVVASADDGLTNFSVMVRLHFDDNRSKLVRFKDKKIFFSFLNSPSLE